MANTLDNNLISYEDAVRVLREQAHAFLVIWASMQKLIDFYDEQTGNQPQSVQQSPGRSGKPRELPNVASKIGMGSFY